MIATVTLRIDDVDADLTFLADRKKELGLTDDTPTVELLQAMWEHDPLDFIQQFMPDLLAVNITE